MLCKKKTSGVSIDDTQRPVFRGGGISKICSFQEDFGLKLVLPPKIKTKLRASPWTNFWLRRADGTQKFAWLISFSTNVFFSKYRQKSISILMIFQVYKNVDTHNEHNFSI